MEDETELNPGQTSEIKAGLLEQLSSATPTDHTRAASSDVNPAFIRMCSIIRAQIASQMAAQPLSDRRLAEDDIDYPTTGDYMPVEAMRELSAHFSHETMPRHKPDNIFDFDNF